MFKSRICKTRHVFFCMLFFVFLLLWNNVEARTSNDNYADIELKSNLSNISIQLGNQSSTSCGACQKWDTRVGKCSPPLTNNTVKSYIGNKQCRRSYKGTCSYEVKSVDEEGNEVIKTEYYSCTKYQYAQGSLYETVTNYGYKTPNSPTENLFLKRDYNLQCPSNYSPSPGSVPSSKIEPNSLGAACYVSIGQPAIDPPNEEDLTKGNEELICTMRQNLKELNLVEHVGGYAETFSCGENCVRVRIGHSGDNYLRGWCTPHDAQSSLAFPYPEAITSAYVHYVEYDDHMQLYVRDRSKGNDYSKELEFIHTGTAWDYGAPFPNTLDKNWIEYVVPRVEIINGKWIQIGGGVAKPEGLLKTIAITGGEYPHYTMSKVRILGSGDNAFESTRTYSVDATNPDWIRYHKLHGGVTPFSYCEHSVSRKRNLHHDLTHRLRSAAPNTTFDFLVRVSVGDEGEGYAEIDIHYDPNLITNAGGNEITGNWESASCAQNALDIGNSVKPGRLQCTRMPDQMSMGCAVVNGSKICPENVPIIPTLDPLCLEAQVFGDPADF